MQEASHRKTNIAWHLLHAESKAEVTDAENSMGVRRARANQERAGLFEEALDTRCKISVRGNNFEDI